MKLYSLIFGLALILFSGNIAQAKCISGNCVNGYGAYTFSNGQKYVGEFKDGKINGQGRYTWPDGRKYVGEYKDGKRNGQGTFTWPDGTLKTGIWKNSKFVKSSKFAEKITIPKEIKGQSVPSLKAEKITISKEIKGQSVPSLKLEKKPPLRRLSLLIGNSNYSYGRKLINPTNDIRSIEKALKLLNFDVISYENCSQKTMKLAMNKFGKKLKDYDVGLFFYAGHGVQVGGSNYLIPIDANLNSENDVELDCVKANRVLAKMEDAGSEINIVILDACRDNPFERSWRRSERGRGLAFMNAPSGSFVAYATAPGKTASDGMGVNGLYTSALLRHIITPGIKIEDVFKRVRSDVEKKSNGDQTPWESTSLKGDFYFKVE